MEIYNSIKNNDFESFKNLVSSMTNLETIQYDISYIDYGFYKRLMNRENVPILHLLASLNYIDFFPISSSRKTNVIKTTR